MVMAGLQPQLVLAGSGVVNNNGTINTTVNLRFPPSAADIATIQNQMTTASQVLWDATEGQLRFGTVTITCGAANEDLGDMWIFGQDGRSGVSFSSDGSGLGRRGTHINQFLSAGGAVVAHEYGHLALGLGDEYSEQNRFGNCWGVGQCIENANLTEQNQCLMQQAGGFSWTELCTPGAHDLVQGNNAACLVNPPSAGGAPCAVNCQFWNTGNLWYETTQQTDISTVDCWTHIVNNFPFLAAPAGLPAQAAPAGFVNPNFVNNCGATDTVMLVLDRSLSMRWNTEDNFGEVCGNGVDDDGDGAVDEGNDCTQPRLSFVQAAARAWLDLANGQGVRAGIISFNELPNLDQPFQTVDAASIVGLKGSVNGLAAGGNTAIGRALSSSALLFGAEAGAVNKTIFLITDGMNSEGEEPQEVIPDLTDQGIRVLAISTGGASDDATLSDVSSATNGARIDTRDASGLVSAFVQQWARYRNEGILIPKLPYAVNDRAEFLESQDETILRNSFGWAADLVNPIDDPKQAPKNNLFQILVEDGTSKVSVMLAGDLGDMNGFGVEAILTGTPGAGPDQFDTMVPDPNMKVFSDSFYVLIEITDPNPGLWTIDVRTRPGSASVQTGNLSVITENYQTDLFTNLDRHIVFDSSEPVELTVTPIFFTNLRNVDVLEANVKRPDGSTVPIDLTSDFDTGGGGLYTSQIIDMPFEGLYEVRVLMATGPNTYNDPGESINAPAPESTVVVPSLQRTALEQFFVMEGEHVCDRRNGEDCGPHTDRPEIEDEEDHCHDTQHSGQVDSDEDGIVDVCDNCPEKHNTDQIDTDDDGAGDACDGCPDDHAKTEPGPCGCDEDEFDGDDDNAPDCTDNCPDDANPDQSDGDGDGIGDACDGCPEDSEKTEPGQCGCGIDDASEDCGGSNTDETSTQGDVPPITISLCGSSGFAFGFVGGFHFILIGLGAMKIASIRRQRDRNRSGWRGR
jgi:hypothetical protein